MKYNVFNSRNHKRLNSSPLTKDQANAMIKRAMFMNGYNIINHPYVIQGIYTPDRIGWKQFLDDTGMESYGAHYDTFVWAMNNNELYFS